MPSKCSEHEGRGYDVKLIIEESVTKQGKELLDPSVFFANLYEKIKTAELSMSRYR